MMRLSLSKAEQKKMAAERVRVLQDHLRDTRLERDVGLTAQPTAGALPSEEKDYSVVLPERLTPAGPWHVHR